jgi:chromosome segregation ATPase
MSSRASERQDLQEATDAVRHAASLLGKRRVSLKQLLDDAAAFQGRKQAALEATIAGLERQLVEGRRRRQEITSSIANDAAQTAAVIARIEARGAALRGQLDGLQQMVASRTTSLALLRDTLQQHAERYAADMRRVSAGMSRFTQELAGLWNEADESIRELRSDIVDEAVPELLEAVESVVTEIAQEMDGEASEALESVTEQLTGELEEILDELLAEVLAPVFEDIGDLIRSATGEVIDSISGANDEADSLDAVTEPLGAAVTPVANGVDALRVFM